MDKIFTEIFTTFKEKISSPFFRYFTISWVLWNYKFVYFIAFLDEKVYFDAHKITKFDYLMNCDFFYWTWYQSLGFFLILPISSALFFIFIFPKYNNKILEKYIEYTEKDEETKMIRRKNIKKRDLEITKITLEEKETETKIIKEKVQQNKEKKTLEVTKFDEWKKEYEEFKRSLAYIQFWNVIEIINFHDWYFVSSSVPYRIQNNIISYLLANKIIVKKEGRAHIHLFTEKGEYFAKLYFEENNK